MCSSGNSVIPALKFSASDEGQLFLMRILSTFHQILYPLQSRRSWDSDILAAET